MGPKISHLQHKKNFLSLRLNHFLMPLRKTSEKFNKSLTSLILSPKMTHLLHFSHSEYFLKNSNSNFHVPVIKYNFGKI